MILLSIIGCVAIFAFGVWIAVSGYGLIVATYGFTGNVSIAGIVILIIGIYIVALSIYNAPFSLVTNG
jgi:hypothetical protein